jgi:hypothetical protein
VLVLPKLAVKDGLKFGPSGAVDFVVLCLPLLFKLIPEIAKDGRE